MGDPSIRIWKDIPLTVNADYPASIPVGDNQVEFSVTFASTGLPVANAEVCVTGANVFYTGFTDETGNVTIEILDVTAETLNVTVRGVNVIPLQGTMNVVQYDVYVEPEGQPVIVDLDGNTDGLINPNENCTITFTLKNWGLLTANNVQATLSTENTNYVDIITTNPVSFGNIAPNGTFTGSPFQFYVHPDCPIGQFITLHLHVTSTGNSWDYYYDEEVMGCALSYNNFVIFDGGNGNLNFRMDPGETVVVVLSISNIGQDIAPDVVGILSSSDPYITIADASGSFGSVNINGIAKNMENFFKVTVSPSCPTGYMANYTLEVSTQNGNYPYQAFIEFQMPVALPIPTDFTGPDSYGYYAYTSDDSFFEQTPVFSWFEIAEIGTAINLPAVSDYTQTVTLPFDFTYYGQVYNQLRISTDGWMAFGGGNQTAPLNHALPYLDNVTNMVGVFWDDLYDNELFLGNILYYNDNANHRFIIEWDSISRNNFLVEPVREVFQAILLNPAYYPTTSGDGEILLQYKKVAETESNTIGIENLSQSIGLQYVYNNDYDATASPLVNEFVIKITTEPPFTNIITGIGDSPFVENGTAYDGYTIEQNQPNPFDSQTRINYSLPENSKLAIDIYNVRGEMIRNMLNEIQPAGQYSIEWDGTNNASMQVGPGIYFYRFQTDGFVKTMKMMKLN